MSQPRSPQPFRLSKSRTSARWRGCVWWMVAAAAVAGCATGGAAVSPDTARESVYRADVRAVLEGVALALNDEDYEHFEVMEAEREVRTAWHPLQLTDEVNTGDEQRAMPSSPSNLAPTSSSRAYQRQQFKKANTKLETRYFVRFHVRVERAPSTAGDNAWRVVVRGDASSWDGTTAPVPLTGAETPYWLAKRVESVQVAIYRRLQSKLAL